MTSGLLARSLSFCRIWSWSCRNAWDWAGFSLTSWLGTPSTESTLLALLRGISELVSTRGSPFFCSLWSFSLSVLWGCRGSLWRSFGSLQLPWCRCRMSREWVFEPISHFWASSNSSYLTSKQNLNVSVTLLVDDPSLARSLPNTVVFVENTLVLDRRCSCWLVPSCVGSMWTKS